MYTAQMPKATQPRKRPREFTSDQERRILEVARNVFDEQFKDKPSAQINFGRALGNLSQPSVSALLKGTYVPGVRRAEYIAHLAGYASLKEMIGPYLHMPDELQARRQMPNLETAIAFYGEEHWPAWTVAAARAGYFSGDDVSPLEWAQRLDKLAKSRPV